jgi:hypothetical protein
LAHYALNDVKEGNMADTDRDVRLQIMLQPEELRAIEDWRFSKRMPSRASAVRELLRRGLTSEGFKLAEAGKQSSSFGVTDETDTAISRKRG